MELLMRTIIISFFFTDTATTEIYTLSLHDALPISCGAFALSLVNIAGTEGRVRPAAGDRKSTRLNSSHRCTSYAVFCLKKTKQHRTQCSCRYTVVPKVRRSLGSRRTRRCTSTPASRSLFCLNDTATAEIYTLSLHDALPS